MGKGGERELKKASKERRKKNNEKNKFRRTHSP